MGNTRLLRKRIIPMECIELKNDIILKQDDDIIITSWNAIKPKKDLHHGFSCYFLKTGIKISKFYKEDDTLMYWYCDIVSHAYDEAEDTYVFTDLLCDVIIYPDGKYKVVDLDEISDALSQGLITSDQACDSLRKLDYLLKSIYNGSFEEMKSMINSVISD